MSSSGADWRDGAALLDAEVEGGGGAGGQGRRVAAVVPPYAHKEDTALGPPMSCTTHDARSRNQIYATRETGSACG